LTTAVDLQQSARESVGLEGADGRRVGDARRPRRPRRAASSHRRFDWASSHCSRWASACVGQIAGIAQADRVGVW